MLQNELQNLKQRDSEIREENEKQYNEMNLLRSRIKELENELKNCEGKAANLQLAVRILFCLFFFCFSPVVALLHASLFFNNIITVVY